MIINTFINKSNTIIENSDVNTGLNPVTEICYGGYKTFFIFNFDLTRIKELLNSGVYPSTQSLTHKLNLYNCGGFTELRNETHVFNQINNMIKNRTASFDLILFNIDQFWDGGNGFEYGKVSNNKTIGSNFYSATSTKNWNAINFEKLITETNVIKRIHFDKGDEGINVDISEYVNEKIRNNKEMYGLGLCFDFENLQKHLDTVEFVSFFTNNSKTFFQPFLQTISNEYINDNRNNIIFNSPTKLYLYINLGGIPTNLDKLPTCKINEVDIDVKQQTKGVYFVELNDFNKYEIDSDIINYDVWDNIIINGHNCKPIEQTFTISTTIDDYILEQEDDDDFVLHTNGIQMNETLQYDECRKLIVTPKIKYKNELTNSISDITYSIKYKDGGRELIIIDNQKMNKQNGKFYIYIDSNSFVPNTYYIDFMVEKNISTRKPFKDKLCFKVLNKLC